MDKKNFSVLIIEDHPLITSAYVSALDQISDTYREFHFEIDKVANCDDAIRKIEYKATNEGIDIIFLDINLPASSDGKYISGEDLGIRIKEILPQSKIIVGTSFNDNYRINCILKSVDPDGFLVKNDIAPDELINAILEIINSQTYYSQSVLLSIRKLFSNGIVLDKIDRQLLYELSVGTKMIDIPDILMMSLRGLHKRKEQMKMVFDIEESDDRELVIKAKEKGFI